MALRLLPGERRLHRSTASLVVVAADYGLQALTNDWIAGMFGMAGKESIGGWVHVTSLRVAFVAHPVNRLRGVFSVPLPVITAAAPWRSGVTVGFELTTPVATVQVMSWSRRAALAAIQEARDSCDAGERPRSGRPEVAALNQASAALFGWTA